MATSPPTVSIGMPLYNASKYVRQAVGSILNQSYTDFELIVSDNCSTDDTFQICQEFASRDHRVKVFRRERNEGAIDNFNFVFRKSVGRYFKWASFDDVILPEFLGECVGVLERLPDVGWCHCTSDIIDEQGKSWLPFLEDEDPLLEIRDGRRWWKGHPRRWFDSKSPVKRFQGVLLGTTWSVDSYGLIRRELLEKTRLLVPLYGAEKVLLAEMSLYARYHHLDEVMFCQRVHDGASGTLTGRSKQRAFVAAQSRRPIVSSRLLLFQAHVYSIIRSNLSLRQKLAGLWVTGRYVFQVRKWLAVLDNVVRLRGAGADGHKMMERARGKKLKSGSCNSNGQ